MSKQQETEKLKLGKFHRFQPGFKPQKKTKKQSLGKQIRDLERLVSREGMPEEIKIAKSAQLSELRKEAKTRRHAVTLWTKYKGIKFVERRKAERHKAKAEKELVKLERDLGDDNSKRITELKATIK